MNHLNPLTIENLLHEGALRRRVTVNAYRALIQAAADRARISFAKTLQVIDLFDSMHSDGEGASTSPSRH